MHYTEPLYRNPYWPTFPLLEITQGCTHNKCKFCNMYRSVKFRMSPLEWVEEDLREIASKWPHAKTIQLLSANPLAMTYDRLAPRLELIRKYLPELEVMYTQTRVSDLRNKTVQELRSLRDLGLGEISLGVESGDDWTLQRVSKGYTSSDILEQCAKLDEAGISYWMTFLNGVAGREHSLQHAENSAKIFSMCRPKVVGTGGLVLFEGTELQKEAERGEFTPCTERELMIELKTFIENLTIDFSRFITHHTSSSNLNCNNFLANKPRILAQLQYDIDNMNLDILAEIRAAKTTL